MRLIDFGAIIAFLCLAYTLLTGTVEARSVGRIFGGAALGLLFIYTSLELNTFLYCYVPGLRPGGISILWSIFALSLIGGGIWKDVRVLRYVGLGLFAVVAAKVFFSDLDELESNLANRGLYRLGHTCAVGVVRLSQVSGMRSQLNRLRSRR